MARSNDVRRPPGTRRSRPGRPSARVRARASSRTSRRRCAMPPGAPSPRPRPTPSSRAADGRRSRASRRRARSAHPAQEDVARGLHEPLAVHHPVAVVAALVRPANGSSTEGAASLICRNSGSPASRPRAAGRSRRAVPTLPTPTTLRAMSTSRYCSSRCGGPCQGAPVVAQQRASPSRELVGSVVRQQVGRPARSAAGRR